MCEHATFCILPKSWQDVCVVCASGVNLTCAYSALKVYTRLRTAINFRQQPWLLALPASAALEISYLISPPRAETTLATLAMKICGIILFMFGAVAAAPPAVPLPTISDRKVRFLQNSNKMYDGILSGVPSFVRMKIQRNMDNAINDMGIFVVAEADMYEIIKRITPKLFISSGLAKLDALKSETD